MDKRRDKTVVKRERTRRALTVEQQQQIQDAVATSSEQAMQEFLTAKISERSSDRTIKDYRRHFRYLMNWLDSKHPGIKLTQITPAILREYVTWMSTEKEKYDDHPRRIKRSIIGLSPVTVNVRIRTMKAFFNWCEREGHVAKSPAKDIKLQKTDEDHISAFQERQVRTPLSVVDRSSFAGFRDYVIMVTLLDTGLRISELFSLKVDDVDFEQLTLTVPWEKAKTWKDRTVPISKQTARLLVELVRENKDFGPQANYLFYSSYGHPMTGDTFDERRRTYGKQAGIEGVRVSAHTFRHTFALHWIKAGGDPFSLQKMLGHTDMSMVRRYVRLSDTDVKDKHTSFHSCRNSGRSVRSHGIYYALDRNLSGLFAAYAKCLVA
ncbi:tyrosine-type recombinase/integrase [Alicyclobacillus fastidiosus]|uniref:Tyrosine-type recombinase/integrase n=1 Tax=Alicyclobacillus fastidiosus TaxID=392011 RepID=A0ABY6ZML8_9BACL|nr:tyrosine-type recombinase/integrase [Alicyclobacillus fastidiosus]WAH44086.1 tyrosine-type recombinase/integrase [Alicyclobacillus fastidiosus]GMA60379.1 tyrosine recombinase XerD [Alicyclobacillus fastidiosus]